MENTTTSEANSEAEVQQGSQETPETVETQTAESGDNLDSNKSTETGEEHNNNNDASDEGGEAQVVEFDSDLDEWASRTGRQKPETDRERQLYQEIRNSQREYSRSKQAKESLKEVDDAVQANNPFQTEENPDGDLESDVNQLKASFQQERAARIRSEYFSEHAVTPEESKVMGQIIKEMADKKDVDGFKYLTNPANISIWHKLAKAELAQQTDTSAVAEATEKRVRQQIAKESQAGPVNRGAKSVSTSEKSETEKMVERFSKWD